MEPLQTWCNLVFNFESVELERGKGSECVADFDAHSLGVECWSEWCTRAVHAWKTVLPDQAQKSGKYGWTKAMGKRADGLQLARYGSDGYDGFDGYDDFDGSRVSGGVDGCDGVVVSSGEGIKVAQVMGLQGDKTSLGTSLRTTVSDGSRSLRRVDRIGEELDSPPRAEGLPYKIDGERAEGFSYKIVGEHVAVF